MMIILSFLLLILLKLTLTPLTTGTTNSQSLVLSTKPPKDSTDLPGSQTTSLSSHNEPFIKKMRFQVPESARLGATTKLGCIYELSGASLHAMKLFKDDKEFYRYTPAIQQLSAGSEEQRIAFASPGLKVDLARSNDQDIWIKILDKRAAGTYKCQVSIEDTFKSISAEKRMEVAERARTIPTGAPNTAATSWLGSSSSATNQQQRHQTVQQQSQRNRAQASFMQQQQQQQQLLPISSGSGSSRLSSKDSSAVLSIICATIIIFSIMISRQKLPQETHCHPRSACNKTRYRQLLLGYDSSQKILQQR